MTEHEFMKKMTDRIEKIGIIDLVPEGVKRRGTKFLIVKSR